MALQTDYGSWIPNPHWFTALDTTTLLVDASGEKAAFIIRIQKTGTIRKIGFRTGNVVQNQTIKVSLQDVSGVNGDPDESIDQFRTISVADTDDNVWKTTGLVSSDGTDSGSLRSVTRGDLIAVVFENNSFTAGDIFRLCCLTTGQQNVSIYCDLKSGAGPAWGKVNAWPDVALIYDDGAGNDISYYCAYCSPISNITTATYNSGSSPNKRGMKFRLPYPSKISGFYINLTGTTNGTFVVKLYDSDGSTVLQTSATFDHDQVRTTSAGGFSGYFPTDQQLSANTYYYVMIEPQLAINVALNLLTVNAASNFDQMEGGQDFHFVDNSGASGAFVATTTQRPQIALLFSAFSDGLGSSTFARRFTGF